MVELKVNKSLCLMIYDVLSANKVRTLINNGMDIGTNPNRWGVVEISNCRVAVFPRVKRVLVPAQSVIISTCTVIKVC